MVRPVEVLSTVGQPRGGAPPCVMSSCLHDYWLLVGGCLREGVREWVLFSSEVC